MRDGHALPVIRDLSVERGDILTVSGPVWGIKALPEMLGPVESNVIETDMTIFAFGIALGAALGLISMTVAGVPLSSGWPEACCWWGWLRAGQQRAPLRRPLSGSRALDPDGIRFADLHRRSRTQRGAQIVETLNKRAGADHGGRPSSSHCRCYSGYAFGRKVLGP
jgi:hypothetical protein